MRLKRVKKKNAWIIFAHIFTHLFVRKFKYFSSKNFSSRKEFGLISCSYLTSMAKT